MSVLVIDASIAVKWVVEEEGTGKALALRNANRLLAPDLLVPECANVLWKKVVRGQLDRREGLLAARLLSAAEIELFGTRPFLETATRLAIELSHPAYDCVHLALAMAQDCPFISADEGFFSKIQRNGTLRMRKSMLLLS